MCDEATKREKSSTKGSTNRSAVEQGTRDYPTMCCSLHAKCVSFGSEQRMFFGITFHVCIGLH